MNNIIVISISNIVRGCSSVGRASGLHPEGRRFDSYQLHHLTDGYTFWYTTTVSWFGIEVRYLSTKVATRTDNDSESEIQQLETPVRPAEEWDSDWGFALFDR